MMARADTLTSRKEMPSQEAVVAEQEPAGPDQAAAAPVAGWTKRHLLDLDGLTAAEIQEVLDRADGMREVLSRSVRKTPALRGKTIVTLFFEASTRTRVSFEQAGKVLGADVINVSASASSVTKGESLLNTVKTLQAMGIDVLVMRHPHSGAPYFVANHIDASVVNAGDGTHAHPTQALLDAYTIRQRLGDIEGRKVAIIGDILYSRVARSEIWALSKLGAGVFVYGPPTLMPAGSRPGEALTGFRDLVNVRVAESMEDALDRADVVMMLRIQQERQTAGHLPGLREYSRVYGLNRERLTLARPHALVMHPGPMNEGVEISSEVAHGERAVIEDQVANGVAVRMAVLHLMAARARSG